MLLSFDLRLTRGERGEAAAFVAWRDAVRLYACAELDNVTNDLREAPTTDGFIAELPAIVWL
jgi:hypothetical protein